MVKFMKKKSKEEKSDMIKVEFKFNLNDKVLTPFGSMGIVKMLGIDGEGIKYYVLTENNSDWFIENELNLTSCYYGKQKEVPV